MGNCVGKDACNQLILMEDTVAHVQVPYNKNRFVTSIKKVIGFSLSSGKVQVESEDGTKSWIKPHSCIVIKNRMKED